MSAAAPGLVQLLLTVRLRWALPTRAGRGRGPVDGRAIIFAFARAAAVGRAHGEAVAAAMVSTLHGNERRRKRRLAAH